MNPTTDLAPSKPAAAVLEKRGNGALSGFRKTLEIVRDYGMSTVAFGTGIYAFILVLQVPMAPEFKGGIALALTLMGLLSQSWVYAREHPRVQSDEFKDHLGRMTTLIERLVDVRARDLR